MARKATKQLEEQGYSKLDAYCIGLHEFYKSLKRAGFPDSICMSMIMEKSAYPDWLLPSIPDRVDRLPYEDDEED
jgi:hypothetical protein